MDIDRQLLSILTSVMQLFVVTKWSQFNDVCLMMQID